MKEPDPEAMKRRAEVAEENVRLRLCLHDLRGSPRFKSGDRAASVSGVVGELTGLQAPGLWRWKLDKEYEKKMIGNYERTAYAVNLRKVPEEPA